MSSQTTDVPDKPEQQARKRLIHPDPAAPTADAADGTGHPDPKRPIPPRAPVRTADPQGTPRRRVRIQTGADQGPPHQQAHANGSSALAHGDKPSRAAELPAQPIAREAIFDACDVSVSYQGNPAIAGISLQIPRHLITALIGPSGCGKSTFLRCLNRMNDSVAGFELSGQILYHGHDLYGLRVDPVEVRRRIGMVFQRPNPLPKSIFDNIAWAPRNLGLKTSLDERVERALRAAALWEEVKDRLKQSAFGLSGGQQQRLCIARAIAIEPDVLLLDEPASALDPIATASIEELMLNLKHRFTIVIVTHNMQQAARIADRTAFFSLGGGGGARTGVLVEYDETRTIFTRPKDPRTGDYVTGRFG